MNSVLSLPKWLLIFSVFGGIIIVFIIALSCYYSGFFKMKHRDQLIGGLLKNCVTEQSIVTVRTIPSNEPTIIRVDAFKYDDPLKKMSECSTSKPFLNSSRDDMTEIWKHQNWFIDFLKKSRFRITALKNLTLGLLKELAETELAEARWSPSET